ncbi:OmpA family protein [Flavobacterium selenitireducens]|uniref:OmpA family protein n=1 Tax=Flavobacterium selenitireducens TaxID=2722704 RepID=UPI00168BC357|nr:OmpA family protein [Flavobacterium selenitireducens]MBD3583584.1 OmpA family protein [Flavobacterium selenitireducens]
MKKLFGTILFLASAIASAQDKTEVFFAFDRHDLELSEKQKLDNWISQHPNSQVDAIYGYCDRIGSSQYNDSLSVKRANAVAEYLKSRQVATSGNLLIKGYGEDFEQSRDLSDNRKVAVLYTIARDQETAKPTNGLKKKMIDAKVGEKVRLPNFNFFNMSDQLVPKSRPVLDELLAIMNDNPNLRIEIQGHICCQTVKEKDYSFVSTQRAKSVYDFLLRNGVAAKRLSYRGFGVSRPLHPIPEKNEKEMDENRRVEIEILFN